MPIGGGQNNQPAGFRPNPVVPPGPEPLIFDQFNGCNTSTTRPGVPDKQAYWLDGFIPVAPRNLRTLYGAGSTLYTASGKTVVWFDFGNIGSTNYMVVFLSDGSVVAVNTSTGATSTILAASMINAPTMLNCGMRQWGREYIIIVADQTNGYWLWNGTTTFTAGTLAPLVTITNAGSAYKTTPNVIITGGHGTGASIAAAIANGFVTGATITNPGSGYLATDTVSLTFSGGNSGGTGGTLTAILSGGTGGTGASLVVAGTVAVGGGAFGISSISVVAGGSGYSAFTTASFVGTGFTVVLSPVVVFSITGGAIISASINVSGGFIGATPTISVTDAGLYYVSSVTVVTGGSGYSPSATVTFTGGSVVSPAAAQLNTNAGGTITSVSVTSPGGYGTSVAPTVGISDAAVTATGSVTLMPFAIQGTWAETYQGRVWVGKQATVYFSAPGSFSNFSTASGGGNFTSADSFLKRAWLQGVSVNGFLYLVGDSSINYISGVQTTGSPPTTTFTNANADAEIGTPYPKSIITWGQTVQFANSVGVFRVAGAKVSKISEMMDGVWQTVTNFGGLLLSMAKATIFGRKCSLTLNRIVDPVSGNTENKLLCYDEPDWFASLQDLTPLTYVKGQDVDSVFTAYGTNGTIISPLFSTASTSFTKTAQTKLWDTPGGMQVNKAAGRFWSHWQYYSTSSPNIIVKIDGVGVGASGQFTNQQPYTITGPVAIGYFVTPPQAVGQQGVMTGMTLQTSAADASLVAAMLDDTITGYRG